MVGYIEPVLVDYQPGRGRERGYPGGDSDREHWCGAYWCGYVHGGDCYRHVDGHPSGSCWGWVWCIGVGDTERVGAYGGGAVQECVCVGEWRNVVGYIESTVVDYRSGQ